MANSYFGGVCLKKNRLDINNHTLVFILAKVTRNKVIIGFNFEFDGKININE